MVNKEFISEIRAYKAEGHTNKEVAKKFGITAEKSKYWCRGIAPQNRDSIERVEQIIARHSPDFEYVSGFTGCDGSVVIRCKKCGHETKRSLITLRRKRCVCEACASAEANKKAKAELYKRVLRAQIIDSHAFNKGKQLSMAFCQSCGALVDNRKTYCELCVIAREKKYSNIKKSRRRIQACTKYSGNITAKSLFERDGGICWICGQPCDINADINDNAYPSVDHLLPISLGGKDEWSNVKLAHRICNSLRRNKI